ncbi:MAG TPA: hypothetical protein VGT02_12075 [Methylomirabilota bacterium]|nr:hypothetical protein [Methylomirabilota bacterium]
MTSRLAGAAAALLATLAPGQAAAEDFSLNVPVRVSSLVPGIRGGLVACVVGPMSIAAVQRPVTHAGERVGFGVEPFPIDASRGFAGTVTVAFDADPGKDPAAATHYKCWLQLTANPDAPGAVGVPGVDANDPVLLPRPGTPFTQVITGELPR